jgi:hypothetical protein
MLCLTLHEAPDPVTGSGQIFYYDASGALVGSFLVDLNAPLGFAWKMRRDHIRGQRGLELPGRGWLGRPPERRGLHVTALYSLPAAVNPRRSSQVDSASPDAIRGDATLTGPVATRGEPSRAHLSNASAGNFSSTRASSPFLTLHSRPDVERSHSLPSAKIWGASGRGFHRRVRVFAKYEGSEVADVGS